MKQLLLLISVSCSLPGCLQKHFTDAQQLQYVLDDWTKKAATGNMDSLMYYWADDAMSLDHDNTIQGKDAIQNMMESTRKLTGFKMMWDSGAPAKLEISAGGDMAYLILGNTMTMPDSTGKTVTIRNTALEAWKKDKSGIWKCEVVMMEPDEKR